MPPLSTSPALLPSEIPTNVVSIPLVLLIGCDPEVEARCRSIAQRARVLVRCLPTTFQRSEVAAMQPLVILVPGVVYESQPWGFEVLAEKVGASLLMLDRDPIAPIVLEYRMMESLVFATRLRARVREAREAREAVAARR